VKWYHFISLFALSYVLSYASLRYLGILVRRTWVEIHEPVGYVTGPPSYSTHGSWIEGTDVGVGSYFNGEFKPGQKVLTYFFLAHLEFRIEIQGCLLL
jgi:hypothetical protein